MGEPVTCSGCGEVVEEAPATWSSQVSGGRVGSGAGSGAGSGSGKRRTWLCDRCTRDNIRSIEGKLDEAWW